MQLVTQHRRVRAKRIRKRRPPWRRRRFIRIEGKYVTREFILKVHGWCNLACTYCYVYEAKDQSWLKKPKIMSRAVVRHVARRLGEYVREHNLGNLNIVLHGGEPLLAGIQHIRFIVEQIRAAVPEGCHVVFRMQTNATLLNERVLLELAELGVELGVSLDGNEKANLKRKLRSGRSSYTAILKGIALLNSDERWKHLFKRVLCVVDLENDPVETIDALLTTGVPGIDLLLPLRNHEPLSTKELRFSDATPYADWLMRAILHWAKTVKVVDNKVQTRIRFFDQIMRLTKYKANDWEFPWNIGAEVIGPYVVGALVIETDGTYELLDGRKTIREGEAFTGLRVHHHIATNALVEMLETTELDGINVPPDVCQRCPLLDICGGGYYLHRWRPANGYNNPSAYCADLKKLIHELVQFMWPTFEEMGYVPKGSANKVLGISAKK